MSAIAVIVLFAVLQNIDNFVLAAAYRLKNVLIPFKMNLLIALFSGIATGLSIIVASGLRSEAVQMRLDLVTDVTGRGILLMLGVWTLVGCFRSRLFRQLGKQGSNDNDDHRRSAWSAGQAVLIRTSEAIIAGTALAVDNLAPSFAFGLINPVREGGFLSGLLLGTLTAGASFVAVVCGQISGRQGRAQFQRFLPTVFSPELISGLLLIGIALLPLDVNDLATDFLKLQVGHSGE
jgi:putative Mn2+ efflux pump MntP